jgi:DNA-binding transcriptional ArsR family regulator
MAEIISPQKTVDVNFSLEPAYNAIVSLSLLDTAEGFSGLNDWVYRTAREMSAEQLRINQLVLQDIHVHLADARWSSFPAWVDDLAAQDATAMRDGALRSWLREIGKTIDGELPAPSELMADRALYLSLVEKSFGRRGRPYDRSYWEEMHGLLADPPTRQNIIVSHLRAMWEWAVLPEWERHLPLLEESITAFESLGLSGLTAAEALSRVVLRAQIPQESAGWLAELDRIIFIPSAHTGPYLIKLGGLSDSTARFAYGARVPEGAIVRTPALSRSELLMRLNALANDTRLRILELLAAKGELGTPDVVAQLELSQSAAARHLEHLTATGYLTTRRQQGTNLYHVNPDQFDHTFQVLKDLCR